MSEYGAMNRFSQNTRRILSEEGLTQKQLALRAGLYPQNLSRALNGINSPSIELVEQVATALDVDIVDLLAPIREPVGL